ncbi:MAG: FxsA family protein, partial [Thiohalomonadaceae bacterium]
MFRILFALFLLIPLLEIYLLIKVGAQIGALATVFLVVFTAMLGALLLRHQGLYTYARVQQAAARGELPTMAMLEGLVLLICGALLLTPGFFTDALGFLGLVPPLRRALIIKVLERGVIHAQR